ncbi:MAG: DNA polymerase IV [Chloroflexota bacterium]
MWVAHFDLDAFFAAVEVLLDPSLAGKPVIVGGDPNSRGVVSTASYEARAFGVHSAMPASRARRLCPQGVFLRPNFPAYIEYSRRVFAILKRFTPTMQALSIDEAFAVLGDEDPVGQARAFKAAVRAEMGLVASLGLASNKLVAKIASDSDKPDGFVVVEPGDEAAFLAPLAVRKLWGVGPKSGARLEELGISTVGELAAAPLELVARAFGPRQARELRQRALGVDDSPVEEGREAKSISDETTFPKDETDARRLWRVLSEQCDDCAARVARHDCLARTVTVKLRYGDFTTITRSLSLPVPTDDAAAVRAAVAALMRQTWAGQRRPLRLIGVRLSGFSPRPELRQLALDL